jgi:hypothetical protein
MTITVSELRPADIIVSTTTPIPFDTRSSIQGGHRVT